MAQKQALYDVLHSICEHVYFNPPEGKNIDYPCIIYNLNTINSQHADDRPYIKHKRYTATVIDRNPYSQLPDMVADLPYCNHDRSFVVDNLYHYVFTLYCTNEGFILDSV